MFSQTVLDANAGRLLSLYESYLSVRSNGSARSFSEFAGVVGDGEKWEKVWQSAVPGRQLGMCGESQPLLCGGSVEEVGESRISDGVKFDADHSLGSSSEGAGPARGKNFFRNQRKKLGKKRTRDSACQWRSDSHGVSQDDGKPAWRAAKAVEREDVDGAVKESVKRKWIARNELQALEAERKVALLKASSVEDAVRAESTRLRAAVESNMVRIEKSHAYLSSTGNVPGEGVLSRGEGAQQGTVETVLSGNGSGSISPSSSASQAEFRAAQKKILDLEAEVAEQAKLFRKHTGISFEALRVRDKETFTDNSENAVIMNELFGEAYVCHNDIKDGKRVIRIGPEDPW